MVLFFCFMFSFGVYMCVCLCDECVCGTLGLGSVMTVVL